VGEGVMARGKIQMVGNRYGDLLVLADLPWRKYPSGQYRRRVLVRCGCGRKYETDAAALREGATKRCRVCGAAVHARRGRFDLSVRLPDGRTVAQVAAAAGLKVDTVYHRFIRGWPHWRLAEAPQAKGRRA
jgi:hypothetical protein